MNQPLNGVAEIPQAHVWNLWSWMSPAIALVGPWNLRIRVSYIPNYKIAISDKITCWEGEQFPLRKKLSLHVELILQLGLWMHKIIRIFLFNLLYETAISVEDIRRRRMHSFKPRKTRRNRISHSLPRSYLHNPIIPYIYGVLYLILMWGIPSYRTLSHRALPVAPALSAAPQTASIRWVTGFSAIPAPAVTSP